MRADRTPRSVALFSASIITGLLALTYTIIVYFLEKEFEWVGLLLFLVFGFVIAYYAIEFFIEKFLYSKVKIIYKTIHSIKAGREGKLSIKMGKDILGQVNREVADWAEEKIKEVKQLRATDNFRKEFIGNLAHELKTPVFNIQGYIDTLLDSGLEDAALTRRFLEKAEASCNRMSDLIKDLDQITLYESGNIPLQLSRFDIVELARKTIDSLEGLAREHNITLRFKNPNERPVLVEADMRKIEQVFTNLFLNSINYGKEGGETRVRFYDMEDNILIEVADDGIGIAQNHLPRVFERFYRVDKSRSRNEGGSGLGLAICKHIIETHNQSISVRSAEEIGSTFSFTLKKAGS
ncbi:MAG: sensor histidine kinase [Crocinitomicaceae bacterium]|nr:sensor histidine kinase [Crocinitomicaceae bacterium]